MIQRLYVHNFRCFENFEFKIDSASSALLIGKNGAGKSTIASVLKVFQSIGRGVNRVGQLVNFNDFSCGRDETPMRFEIEVILDGNLYHYQLALELQNKFKELSVFEESLSVAGAAIYSRTQAKVVLHKERRPSTVAAGQFMVDWHLVALPVIQPKTGDSLSIFKSWLQKIVLLAPIPQKISGESFDETLNPLFDASNLGDWFSGLLSQFPAAYGNIQDYLHGMMPDMSELQNEPIGKDAKRIIVHFMKDKARFSIGFDRLSDGEKCFFLCAIVLAANKAYGPLFCFWDEPDNYLSMPEVGYFVLNLRKSFLDCGQIIMTTHNEEAIRKFSVENTWVMDRKSHLEPSLIRKLSELPKKPDLIDSILAGDLAL